MVGLKFGLKDQHWQRSLYTRVDFLSHLSLPSDTLFVDGIWREVKDFTMFQSYRSSGYGFKPVNSCSEKSVEMTLILIACGFHLPHMKRRRTPRCLIGG